MPWPAWLARSAMRVRYFPGAWATGLHEGVGSPVGRADPVPRLAWRARGAWAMGWREEAGSLADREDPGGLAGRRRSWALTPAEPELQGWLERAVSCARIGRG